MGLLVPKAFIMPYGLWIDWRLMLENIEIKNFEGSARCFLTVAMNPLGNNFLMHYILLSR